MRIFKSVLAILLVLALLTCVPVAVSAEEAVAEQELFIEDVKNSITVEETTGLGLAFLFEMNVRGAAVNAGNEFVSTNAVAMVDGVDYRVVSMGAVMTNQPAYMANLDNLTLDAVNEDGSVLNVPAKYLYSYDAETCSFAVRIINLPEGVLGLAVAGRPYCVLKDAQGNETILYGEGDVSSYNEVYYTNTPDAVPTLDPAIGNVDDRLTASATAEYAAIADNYREGFKVSVTLNNLSVNAATTEDDTITYVCKDAEGNALATKTVPVGVMVPGESKVVEFYAPIATVAIEQAAANLCYVPVIALPVIGSDIDVTNKKDRIHVSATSAAFDEVGTIQVSVTLNNVSVNAATTEGDTVTYVCKDAEGNVLGTEIVSVGEVKPDESKTVEFYAPIATVAIEQTEANLNYVPVISLPAIGSDIDVTKKKDRIRVSAAEASFNEDDTIRVSLTFRNYTSNWITEETDYVKYTYYNAAGDKIQTETLYIGCIDTKKNPAKTFTFDLPANAASLKITSSKIVYWTEWS